MAQRELTERAKKRQAIIKKYLGGNMAQRELTEREKKRQAIVENLIHEKEAQGYKRIGLELNADKFMNMVLAYTVPLCIPFAIIFLMTNSIHLNMVEGIVGIIALAVFTVVHELIHGLMWGIFAKKHFKSIEFGYVKDSMLYCTCTEPLTKGQYFVGGIMPGLILGIIPMIIAILTGSFASLIVGAVMTLGAGGDIAVIVKLFRYKTDKSDILYMDHPTEVGMIVLEK